MPGILTAVKLKEYRNIKENQSNKKLIPIICETPNQVKEN